MSGQARAGILWSSRNQTAGILKRGELKVAVIGLGRIGLPTAALLAVGGANVVGVDILNRVVVETNAGVCRLRDEPGLEKAVERAVKRGKLRATLDPAEAVPDAHFIVICVPTPVDSAKSPDYTAVVRASRTVGKLIRRGSIVIIESTIGPGVGESLVVPIIEAASGMKAGTDFGFASCPERSDPGNIVANMKTLPRVVGSSEERCGILVAAFYELALGVEVLRVSSPRTANAVKLTENLFRDVNIALVNEFALLYEKFGIDTLEVIKACSTKYNFMPHYPGAGVGGPCLPSNAYYLIAEGIKVGNIPYLVRLAREINDRMPDHVAELATEALNESGRTIKGARIAILGVAYKADVKDIQLAPMERVVRKLAEMGGNLSVYDPMFAGETAFGYPVAKRIEDVLEGAECIIIGTDHAEFRKLSLAKIAKIVKPNAALVDARNLVSPLSARRMGFSYRGVGRSAGPAPTRSSGGLLGRESLLRSTT